MHLAVAVRAGTSCFATAWILRRTGIVFGRNARHVRAYWCTAGMCAVMALLTQERCTRLQQRRNVRAMGAVAVGAILTHRLVLEQEGAAFFSMALVAGFCHRIFLELLRPG